MDIGDWILNNISGTYSIIKKEWDWLDISRKCNVNCYMSCNFIDGWIFDEILEIEITDCGVKGLLITLDHDGYSKRRESCEMVKQTKIEVLKSIMVNCFGFVRVMENRNERYFLEGCNIWKFFKEWKKRVRGRNFIKDGKTDYKIFVDGKLSYFWLNSKYFMNLGFENNICYCGAYDMIEDKVKFSLWSDGGVFGGVVSDKYINLFDGKDVWNKGVYMCEFNGSLEEFGVTCGFLCD